MALYAFDGTGKKDAHEADEDLTDTNVARFFDACEDLNNDHNYYAGGVGTRLGPVCRGIGKMFGVGGLYRGRKAYEQLRENFAKGDTAIDIVGFSRGAALALNFANVIHDKGVLDGDGTGTRRIRFLGLWDVVGSIGLSRDILGIPFQRFNPGYRLTVPENVDHCFRAMALDERRGHFKITRLDENSQHSRVREVWFRGVHSDVGGGNQNTALSHITLKWMLLKAKSCGLRLKDSAIESLEHAIDFAAPLVEPKDLKMEAKRKIHPSDVIHHSVGSRDDDRYNNPLPGLRVDGPD